MYGPVSKHSDSGGSRIMGKIGKKKRRYRRHAHLSSNL